LDTCIQAFKNATYESGTLVCRLREYQGSFIHTAMTRYSFYIAGFTSEPFQPPPELKVADVIVEANRLARLTFIQLAISPKVYSSLEELKQVHFGSGSKATLRPQP